LKAISVERFSGAESMVPIDGEMPGSEPARPEFETQPNRAERDPVAQNKGRLLGIALVAGLLAGAASSLAGESIMSRERGD
jgi:hypothetical protein